MLRGKANKPKHFSVYSSFEPFAQKVHLNKDATDLDWPPKVPDVEPDKTTKSSIFDLRVLCGDSHSSFLFSLYKYPPAVIEKPPSGGQPSASPQKPQARRSSLGYTSVSFTTDKDGVPQFNMSASERDRPIDPTKVYYSEVNVAKQQPAAV